jgi:uncharacterized membrane protein
MDLLARIGRLLYAVAILVFGLQCLSTGSGKKLYFSPAGPPWTQTERGLALLAGLGLIAFAICLALRWYGRGASNTLGVLILLRALLFYLPQLISHPHDPRLWTPTFELIALGGAALVMARTMPASDLARNRRPRERPQQIVSALGRWLFALSLIVFGVLHMMYPAFIAALIPQWIPFHLFWAWATGVAFFLAAVSLILRWQVWLSASLLGLMFLLWVLIVHMPRVHKAPLNGNEWTSEFIALAMSGASFVLAGALSAREEEYPADLGGMAEPSGA